MSKKHASSRFMTVALLSVASSSAVVMASMTSAERDASPSVVAYTNTSANAYQPISDRYQQRVPGERSVTVSSAPATTRSKAALNRAIKKLNRTIKSVHKRLMHTEDSMDVLKRMISTVSGDTQGLQASLVRLENTRDQLSDHLADLNTDRAELTRQLQDTR